MMSSFRAVAAASACVLAGAVVAVPVGPAAGAGGTAVRARTTYLNLTATGASPAQGSYRPSISEDGRWVAFWSEARLVADDTNTLGNLYLRDLVGGSVRRIPGVSVEADLDLIGGPVQAGTPQISADGRVLAYSTGGGAAWTYDRTTGLATPILANRNVDVRDISANGRFVLFRSSAQDLAPGAVPTRGGVDQFYVYDRTTKAVRRAVPKVPGVTLASYYVSMSDDGTRFLVRASHALNRDGKGAGAFLRARSSTRYLRVPYADAGYGDLDRVGRYVAFTSERGLLRADTNRMADVYRWDSRTGGLARLSVTTQGRQCTDRSIPGVLAGPGAHSPVISADGASVLFRSACGTFSGYTRGDGYNPAHLYVRDTRAHTLTAVDRTDAGALPRTTGVSDSDGFSFGYDLSGNGSRAVFTAEGRLAPQDRNQQFDAYVRGPLR